MQDVQGVKCAAGVELRPRSPAPAYLGKLTFLTLNQPSLEARTRASWDPRSPAQTPHTWKEVQIQVHLCQAEPG